MGKTRQTGGWYACLFFFIALIIIALSQEALGATAIINPSGDTYVAESTPGRNYCTNTTLVVGKSPGAFQNSAFLKFPTNGIPPGQTVTSAQCNFYIYSSYNPGGYLQMHLCRTITNTWDACSVNWYTMPLEAPNTCTQGQLWSGPAPTGFVTYDCTNQFNWAYTGGLPLSVILEPGYVTNGNYLNMYSMEIANPNQKPYIYVEYHGVPTPVYLQPPSGITATSMNLLWSQFSPQGDFGRYELHRSTTNCGFSPGPGTKVFETTNVQQTTYTDTSLVPNTTYYYKVRVYDRWNQIADSNCQQGKTLCQTGWFCLDDMHKAFRNADCSYNQVTQCDFGYWCQSGQCVVHNPHAPLVTNVDNVPQNPSPFDQVVVHATVTDAGGDIQQVRLHWTVNNGAPYQADMGHQGNEYSITIGPFASQSTVSYYITARDTWTETRSEDHQFAVQGISSAHVDVYDAPTAEIANAVLSYMEEDFSMIIDPTGGAWWQGKLIINFTQVANVPDLSLVGEFHDYTTNPVIILSYDSDPITTDDLKRVPTHELMHLYLSRKAQNWYWNEGLMDWAHYAVFGLKSPWIDDNRIPENLAARYGQDHNLLKNYDQPQNVSGPENWKRGASADFWEVTLKNVSELKAMLDANTNHSMSEADALALINGRSFGDLVYEWKGRYPYSCSMDSDCLVDAYVGGKIAPSGDFMHGSRLFRDWSCNAGACAYQDSPKELEMVTYLAASGPQCTDDEACEEQVINEIAAGGYCNNQLFSIRHIPFKCQGGACVYDDSPEPPGSWSKWFCMNCNCHRETLGNVVVFAATSYFGGEVVSEAPILGAWLSRLSGEFRAVASFMSPDDVATVTALLDQAEGLIATGQYAAARSVLESASGKVTQASIVHAGKLPLLEGLMTPVLAFGSWYFPENGSGKAALLGGYPLGESGKQGRDGDFVNFITLDDTSACGSMYQSDDTPIAVVCDGGPEDVNIRATPTITSFSIAPSDHDVRRGEVDTLHFSISGSTSEIADVLYYVLDENRLLKARESLYYGENDNHFERAEDLDFLIYSPPGTHTYTAGVAIVPHGAEWDEDNFVSRVEEPFTVDVNHPPAITAYNPQDLQPRVKVGDALDFSIQGSDADNDPLAVAWREDGVLVSTNLSFHSVANAGDEGTHNVTAAITDVHGESAAVTWNMVVYRQVSGGSPLFRKAALAEMAGRGDDPR